MDDATTALRIHLRGVVQGVGFRPFVARTAEACGITGWVINDVDGVRVHAEGAPLAITSFVRRLETEAPPAATIDSVSTEDVPREGHSIFEIRRSDAAPRPTTRISPDLCVCDECLREMRDPDDPRVGYAYINCTACGPRYSIIRGLPYDRAKTTMADWPLCAECRRAYDDQRDRRYHAQPVACPRCGPVYRLERGGQEIADGNAAVERAARLLAEGAILAVKGIGGYHLACDAEDRAAVTALRERKFRKEKPFALLAASLDRARTLVRLGPATELLLTSIARPIVLAPARRALPGVAPGRDEFGVMLPYAPLHHLLFDAGAPDPLVMTSANRSDEPIAYRDDDARERLSGIADAFLVGERPIQRRVDDSVVSLRRGRPFMIRRARGYAPGIVARVECKHPILAVGADLKNAVALAVDGQIVLSQHVGDLGDLEVDRSCLETIEDLLAMYDIDRSRLVVAHDMHPEYHSTRLARQLVDRTPGALCIAVQHHAAHIAGALAERERFDETFVGVALDGTGYGTDGTIWGGEILVGSVRQGFRRTGSLSPVRMPGGDAAARYPAQALAAYLNDERTVVMLEGAPFELPDRYRQACALVHADVRCTTSTSTGRLFDAAAALLGFTREITYEGQAAIWLEQLAHGAVGRTGGSAVDGLDSRALLQRVVEGRREGRSRAELAHAFHHDLAAAFATAAIGACRARGSTVIVLSGGVWQNEMLLDLFTERVEAEGLEVLLPNLAPVNDGGIAVGQVAIASVGLG